MSALLAIALEANGSSLFFWGWILATLLLATGLGFAAGALYSSRSADRSVRKASQRLPSLFSLVVDSFDKSERLMGLLEKFPRAVFSADQIERLDAKRGSLMDSVSRFVGAQRDPLKPQVEGGAKPKAQPIRIEWDRSSLDPATGLPDRKGFDANLHLMLEAGSRAGCSSGLLLLRIDRMDQLKSRFGLLGADTFIKTMAAVISRAIREQDLACRLDADSFALLIPSVDADAGRKLSQAVRNSVRVHTFRVLDVGPEVLVTASFGYTHCEPKESPELVLAEAGNALAQSIRRGRNQLHASDGETVVHCPAI